MRTGRLLVTAVVVASVGAAAVSAGGPAEPSIPVVSRASVASSGEPGEGLSRGPRIAGANGRYVVFVSDAADLVPGDGNGQRDVFLRDRSRGRTERVSVAADGTEGDGPSFDPAVSDDGRFVAFESVATNLVDGDDNSTRDVFLADRGLGTVELVSLSTAGEPGDDGSSRPVMTPDGAFVGFRSTATNLVLGDTNGAFDVFVREVATGVTTRVSVHTDGGEGDGASAALDLSADGRFVAFESAATNLVDDDDNDSLDVFVHDRATGVTERVSVRTGGAEANGDSRFPAISGDGRFVVFESAATDLVEGDTNDAVDVFVHDRTSDRTVRVSVATDGAQASGDSDTASIARDGSAVAFASDAPDLVDADGNGARDVFVRYLADRVTVRVEPPAPAGAGAGARRGTGAGVTDPDGPSDRPRLGAAATLLVFDSEASNFVAGDEPVGSGGFRDVFVAGTGTAVDAFFACRLGNVGAAVGAPSDVVFVNGSPGSGLRREIVLAESDPLEIAVALPPSRSKGRARFVLYAWIGAPDPLTVREVPFSLGVSCLPTPLEATGDDRPAPVAIWNNLGKFHRLGKPTFASEPAPSVAFVRAGGIGRPIRFFLQGFILDDDAPQGQAAVTNGVEVVVLPD